MQIYRPASNVSVSSWYRQLSGVWKNRYAVRLSFLVFRLGVRKQRTWRPVCKCRWRCAENKMYWFSIDLLAASGWKIFWIDFTFPVQKLKKVKGLCDRLYGEPHLDFFVLGPVPIRVAFALQIKLKLFSFMLQHDGFNHTTIWLTNINLISII